jgi:LysM repeat protein
MSKNAGSGLSDEFKKHIKETRSNKNIFGVITALIAVILVFSFLGVASYEIFFKQAKAETKSASEKIESKPGDQAAVAADTSQTEKKTETPATPATPAASTSSDQTTTYVVVEGDVLGSIAGKFNTTVAKIKELNNITDENSLQIGQTLKVPKQ